MGACAFRLPNKRAVLQQSIAVDLFVGGGESEIRVRPWWAKKGGFLFGVRFGFRTRIACSNPHPIVITYPDMGNYQFSLENPPNVFYILIRKVRKVISGQLSNLSHDFCIHPLSSTPISYSQTNYFLVDPPFLINTFFYIKFTSYSFFFLISIPNTLSARQTIR